MQKHIRKILPVSVGIVAIMIVCIIILAAVLITQSGTRNKFPMWEPAQEEDCNENVRLEFVGIDYGVSDEQDEVLVRITDVNHAAMGTTPRYHIDFLEDSEWYTVYNPEMTQAMQAYTILYDPGTDITKPYRVPAGLFSVTGQYRIYIDYLGYCEIDIPVSFSYR